MKKRQGVHPTGAPNLGLILALGLKTRTVNILEPGEAAKIQWTNGATTVTGISMLEIAQ